MNRRDRPGLAAALRGLCPEVLPREAWGRRRTMWRADLQRRMAEVNRREDEVWARVASVSDWERFRDRRIAALRASLGGFPAVLGPQRARVTGELRGDGYQLQKLVYETRPGLVVAALLYRPEPAQARMPLIQLCHAHHRPKDQAELQDMGVNWARSGCAVLVPDLVGHGERREDPFGGRQGYYARYYSAMQLHLVGESLAGWMVWDLLRGHDLLLALPGADPERLMLIGAVAGGGDLAALAAALDPRVRCVIPFNFGAGSAWRDDLGGDVPPGVNLARWGYWETTRNLLWSARDGFLPWVIVAAAAPRHLVYAHEFAWEPAADPAWARLRKVYELYGAAERLGWMKGAGQCAPGSGNTHCTNVGPVHRAGLYPWLEKWFGMPPPLPERQDRREAADLVCLDEAARGRAVPVRALAGRRAQALLAPLRAELDAFCREERRARLRRLWGEALGETGGSRAARAEALGSDQVLGHTAERVLLRVEPGIDVPVLLLLPDAAQDRVPAVVCLAHGGKGLFLERRAPEIGRLLEAGTAVCLPDLRGTGETRPDEMHGLESEYIGCSEDERMLGRSVLGLQLGDLRAVLGWLRLRPEISAGRVGLWGESFAPLNLPSACPQEHDPRLVDNCLCPNLPHGPAVAEPAGPILALLGGLFEETIPAILLRRGLAGMRTAFGECFLAIPSDAVVPGSMPAGDLADLAAAFAPRPLRVEGPVDACNCAMDAVEMPGWFRSVSRAYAGSPRSFTVTHDIAEDGAEWLTAALRSS